MVKINSCLANVILLLIKCETYEIRSHKFIPLNPKIKWWFTHILTPWSPSWETYLFSASHEIPRILWNSKVLCLIHKCPPPEPIKVSVQVRGFLFEHFVRNC